MKNRNRIPGAPQCGTGSDVPFYVLIGILILVFLVFMYAAIEPFIYYYTGFGFIYEYCPR